MKTFIIFLLCSLAGSAWALPVLNENVSTYSLINIYPDDKDANKFYVAPNFLSLERDAKGVPLFSYIEYQKSWSITYAKVQAILTAKYHDDELKLAKVDLMKKFPAARFSSVPFTDSKIAFGDVLKDFIEVEDCDHKAGLIGDEQICSFELNDKGRFALRQLFQKNLTLTMRFEYSVLGVTRQADGTFITGTGTRGIAARIGGDELGPYPQLFEYAKARGPFSR